MATPYATMMPVPTNIRTPGGGTSGFNEGTYSLPPYMRTNPTFEDVTKNLTPLNPVNAPGYQDLFEKGQTILAGDTSGMSAGTNEILANIKKMQDINRATGVATAQGLAAQYGRGGSSTEQFGVQQAGAEADKTAMDATTNVYMANLARQQAARDLQARALFDLNQSAYTGTLDMNKARAGYTSEEIASQRNAMYAQSMLELQKLLGEQGIAAAYANIEAEKDMAKKQAKQDLLGQLLGIGGNLAGAYLMRGAFGGGGGAGGVGAMKGMGAAGAAGGWNLFGNAVPAATGAGAGGVPLAPATMFGPGGTLFNTAGTSGIGFGSVAAGLGGYYLASKGLGAGMEGDQAAMNWGGAIGGLGGSMFGPGGAFLGAAAGTAAGKVSNRIVEGVEKKLGGTAGSIARYSNPLTAYPAAVKKVSKTIKKVFAMMVPSQQLVYA